VIFNLVTQSKSPYFRRKRHASIWSTYTSWDILCLSFSSTFLYFR